MFLTNAWRYTKGAASALGGLAGIGVVIGGVLWLPASTIGGASLIAAGGLEIILALFNLYDSSKVWADMKKKFEELSEMIEKFTTELNDFKGENEKLKSEREQFAKQNQHLTSNVQNLTTAEQNFEHENEKLKIIVEENKNQLLAITQRSQELENELKELQHQKEEYEKQNKEFDLQNEDLKTTVHKIKETQSQLQLENATYREIQTKLENQVRVLDGLKEDYKKQNEDMQNLLQQETDKVTEAAEQIESLKTQLSRFVQLYENMKSLVKNLVSAGDMYQSFSTTIGTDVEKLDMSTSNVEGAVSNLLNIVNRLNKDMTEEDFNELDTDGDGKVTKTEWERKYSITEEEPLPL